jgi:Ca-activated chloride channel family protein
MGLVLAMMSGVAVADDVWVSISSPRDGDLVIGEVEVIAEVVAVAEVTAVEFYADGRLIGVLSLPPYRMRIDLGGENMPHRLRVVARDSEGSEASAEVTTQPVPISAEIQVELQQLYVTVSQLGRRVLDLRPEDFRVSDEKRDQELVTFALGDIPFTASLLIDASASMFGQKLEAAQAGAAAFVRGMAELDQCKVMVFSDKIQNSTPFTGVRDVLTAGLAGAVAEGGTALNDHMYLALKMLEQRQGRRVVILLSDGVDSHSVLPMDDVLARARRSQALIYWIRLTRPGGVGAGDESYSISSSWRSASEYRHQIDLLRRTVEESGGRIVDAQTPDEIAPIFVEILQELREQYVLGYYPSIERNDGSWHEIEVTVNRPGVEVRTHEGYIDF